MDSRGGAFTRLPVFLRCATTMTREGRAVVRFRSRRRAERQCPGRDLSVVGSRSDVVRSVVSNRVLSFEDEQARRGAYARSDRGLYLIDVARITGSVGRASVLNRLFRFARHGQADGPPAGERQRRRFSRAVLAE